MWLKPQKGDFMQKIFSPLFKDISDNEWTEMLSTGCIRQKLYHKDSVIFSMGETTDEIGIVISGNINIENIDFQGNRTILSNISMGQVFAETYAVCQEPLMVEAVAGSESEILFLNIRLLKQEAYSASTWHSKLTQNLLLQSMHKNLILSSRIFCTSPRTIRERLMVYLSAQSGKSGSLTFQIPFDRQQLADYLNVDRSALSKELGKMRKEGILDFHKSTFRLIQHQDFIE